MTRRDREWLSDIEDAIDAVSDYVADGDLHDGVVYDACRARLMEIGEAVKHVDPISLPPSPMSRGIKLRECATSACTTITTPTSRSSNPSLSNGCRRFARQSFDSRTSVTTPNSA